MKRAVKLIALRMPTINLLTKRWKDLKVEVTITRMIILQNYPVL